MAYVVVIYQYFQEYLTIIFGAMPIPIQGSLMAWGGRRGRAEGNVV
jgi:hypothetical protein